MTKVSETLSDSVDEVSGHDYIKKYAKQMLKNSLFIGTFQEKRFVEPLNSYRDVVTIATEEEHFIRNLLVVKKKVDEGFLKKPWLGLTDPETVGAPVGYNLWVELKEEVFGKYWYKVKTVEFFQSEIRLKLDIIRPVTQENSPSRMNISTVVDQSSSNVDSWSYFNQIVEKLKLNLLNFYTSVLTFENIKHSVIFLFLLVGAIITGGVSIIQYLLEYLLLLLRELSFLIKSLTPIVITFTNLIGRSIFGFYSMIVALYKTKSTPAPVYNAYLQYDPKMGQYQRYVPNNYPREIQYYPNIRSRSGVTITPMQ